MIIKARNSLTPQSRGDRALNSPADFTHQALGTHAFVPLYTRGQIFLRPEIQICFP